MQRLARVCVRAAPYAHTLRHRAAGRRMCAEVPKKQQTPAAPQSPEGGVDTKGAEAQAPPQAEQAQNAAPAEETQPQGDSPAVAKADAASETAGPSGHVMGVETATHTADGYEKYDHNKVELTRPPSYYQPLSKRQKWGGRAYRVLLYSFLVLYMYLQYFNNRENQLIETRFKGLREQQGLRER